MKVQIGQMLSHCRMYHKAPKFSDTGKLCCNQPKIQTKRQTLGCSAKKMQME